MSDETLFEIKWDIRLDSAKKKIFTDDGTGHGETLVELHFSAIYISTVSVLYITHVGKGSHACMFSEDIKDHFRIKRKSYVMEDVFNSTTSSMKVIEANKRANAIITSVRLLNDWIQEVMKALEDYYARKAFEDVSSDNRGFGKAPR